MTASSDGRSMGERMLAGDLYIADDPEPAEHNPRAFDLMDDYKAASAWLGYRTARSPARAPLRYRAR